ncbi:L-rhamnose mutarotase [Seonamhaeicola sp.]|uniref:L-rhamnose mutarotase n=1 Tax=Seonamhaeicola sp. TaxID=1912245 RepID=UPI002618CC88|nr:L-rhamnose mutarotase [Seonamhaeicola sp.]
MSAGQFRRFTYLVTSGNQVIPGIIGRIKSEGIQKQLKETGIFTFEIYQKEDTHFLLIDAEKHMNSAILNSTLLSVSIDFKAFHFESTPLDRIYKLEQKVVYAPTDGQLKTSVAPYKRFVWTLLLEPDLIEEYKSVHAMGMAWPEITANMKSVGVKDMEIYIHKDQVVLIMDTEPDFDLDEVGPKWQKLPREEEWQAYVAKFQRTDPESSIQEKWQDMRPL